MTKLVKVIAARDFSSTLFGNVSQGQVLKVSPERKREWVKWGLVEAEKVDLSKMTKDELEKFCKEKFDIDLDKRKKIDALREDVQMLIDMMDD